LKFVIRPYSTPSWVTRYFPGLEALNLKICNKPLIEYYLDFLYLLNCDDLLILIPYYQKEIFDYLERESEWGIKIRIEIAADGESFRSIENRYSNFFTEEKYSKIEGSIFIKYNQCDLEKNEELKNRNRLNFSPIGSSDSVILLDTLMTYFNLSQKIASEYSGHYNLPGFGYQNDSLIGKGVICKNKSSISKGVHLGNYALVHRDSILNKGAIVGDHVIVGQFVEMSSSIVFDNTVIGDRVILKDKIIFDNKVICPKSGAIAIVDQKLLLPLYNKRKYKELIEQNCESIIALMLVVYATPVYLFTSALSWLKNKKIKKDITIPLENNNSVIIQEIDTSLLSENFLFRKINQLFFVDYYIRYFLVLKKKIKIIGPESENASDSKISVYKFSSLCRDPDLVPFNGVVDLFYREKSSLVLNFYALFKLLFSRIMTLVR